MNYQLGLREEHWKTLSALLAVEEETAGVLVARVGTASDVTTFLGRQIHLVPDEHYLIREPLRLSIASMGYVPALGRAADDGAAAVFFHTHPGGSPKFSPLDEEVDRQLRSPFIHRTRQGYFVSLVIGGTAEEPRIAGRVYLPEAKKPLPLSRIRVVGDRIRVFEAGDAGYRPPQQFDRQVRAFGAEGQRVLSGLHVGVVGLGGTGSAVCEQLLRLGVGQLTLLDDDVVEETNLTRIHEASRADVGRPKVDVFADRAEAISQGARVTKLRVVLRSQESARALAGCDAIFGCTDDQLGRSILSRLAYWYLVPIFDMGFMIDSQGGRIRGLYGRITTLVPGSACLLCRGRISAQQMSYEALSVEERLSRIREGYAPELGEPAPSVVTYTSLVGATAVAELLERLFGIGTSSPPSELLLRVGERSISRTSVEGRPEHFCTDSSYWGLGDQEPMLGQIWPAS